MQLSPSFDTCYAQIYNQIVNQGVDQEIQMQTGVYPVVSLFNSAFTFPGHLVPLLGLRKVHLDTMLKELKWILLGHSNISFLEEKSHIWKPWVDSAGNLPSSYGRYLRSFPCLKSLHIPGEAYHKMPDSSPVGWFGVDQFSRLVNGLVAEYPSRRLQVSFMHPDNHWASKLPPCISGIGLNWYVNSAAPDLRQVVANIKFRSSDFGVGFVYDILQWYLFVQIVIEQANSKMPPNGPQYRLSAYTFSADNQHVYMAHVPKLEKVCSQPPTPPIYWHSDVGPTYNYLKLNDSHHIPDLNIEVSGYLPYPHVKLELIV